MPMIKSEIAGLARASRTNMMYHCLWNIQTAPTCKAQTKAQIHIFKIREVILVKTANFYKIIPL
ncbi:MAG: hypothetical protein ACYC6R_03730, partial [Anaerolineales bacterium]